MWLNSLACLALRVLEQWNVQDLQKYHLAIHGSGGSLDHLTSLDVGYYIGKTQPKSAATYIYSLKSIYSLHNTSLQTSENNFCYIDTIIA